MKITRRKIHTGTKWMVFHGILPEKFYVQLSRSQVSRYRKLDFNEYYGSELFAFSDDVVKIAGCTAKNDFDRRVIRGYLKLMLTLRNAFASAKHFHQTLGNHKEQITDVVQRIKKVIPLKACAKLIGVAESSLRNWITRVRVKCSDSLINICRKVHPNQLLPAEAHAMRKLLADVEFKFWPLRSLYYYALNNKLVSMGLSTWYKYAGLLNVKRLKPFSVKKYAVSVKASRPNEIWHADVSYFKSRDGLLNYLYTVADNFSRFPLVAKVSTKLCGKIRTETFREALRFAVKTNPTLETINLIVDGGAENFNKPVNEFLSSLGEIEIKRIRALKDVAFSNSMAEALNKIIKCGYLNHMTIENTSQLEKAIELVREDFAFKRPHGGLNGLTPYEVYTGKVPSRISFAEQIKNARENRAKTNPNLACSKCLF